MIKSRKFEGPIFWIEIKTLSNDDDDYYHRVTLSLSLKFNLLFWLCCTFGIFIVKKCKLPVLEKYVVAGCQAVQAVGIGLVVKEGF